jgi:hypothetical protein
MLAGVAAVGLVVSAMPDRAHATTAPGFRFTHGDAVLVLYGNGTEALYNLGNARALLATAGASRTIDVHLTAAAHGGNPVRWTIFGFDGLAERIWAGTSDRTLTGGRMLVNPDRATMHAAIDPININPMQQIFVLGQWEPGSAIPGNTIPMGDPNSFTTRMMDGNPGWPRDLSAATIGGGWREPNMFANVGDFLHILETGVGDFNLHWWGSAQLLAGGPLGGQVVFGNPGPIPVPAAAILFGSGLIGLAGLARTRVKRHA